ncbi:MAG TPA: hypothetical protein VH044_00735 [Polyangiaceae bacterium]|nr:hypothetical protein [Polyangiaceae bacterium]
MSLERSPSAARFFVGGLGSAVTEVDLVEAFSKIGVQLESIELMMNRATGCSRGFALGVLRRAAIGDPVLTEDELMDQLRTAVVCGRAVTVHPVPASARRRSPV